MIREANEFDKLFFSCGAKLQLLFHCGREENVPKVLEKLRKLCLPLRVKYENEAFFWNDEEPPVVQIPENIKNLDDAARFMADSCNPNPSSYLGVIAANKNIVATNVSHVLWDGSIMLHVTEAIVNDIEIPEINSFYNSFHTFPDEIKKSEAYPDDDMTHPGYTSFTSKDKFFKAVRSEAQSCTVKIPANELKVYDPVEQKPRGLTDALYANICLSCAAFEGKLDKIGIKTVVDLRKYIPFKYGWERSTLFSMVDVIAEGVTEDTTIREVMRKTRESFNQRIKDGVHFGFLKHFNDEPDISNQNKKFRPGLSNIGIFPIGGMIDDVLIKDANEIGPEGYYGADFGSYSVRGLGRNDIFTWLEYNQQELSRREAELLLKSVEFGLRNLDIDITCGQALKKLQEFQQNYIKNEYPKYSFHYKK